MEEIRFPKPDVHVFVCINDRSERDNPMPSCGPQIKAEDVKEVKKWIIDNGWTGRIICTKAKCLGFCNEEGGVACVYPSGKFFKGLQSAEDIKQIILTEIK